MEKQKDKKNPSLENRIIEDTLIDQDEKEEQLPDNFQQILSEYIIALASGKFEIIEELRKTLEYGNRITQKKVYYVDPSYYSRHPVLCCTEEFFEGLHLSEAIYQIIIHMSELHLTLEQLKDIIYIYNQIIKGYSNVPIFFSSSDMASGITSFIFSSDDCDAMFLVIFPIISNTLSAFPDFISHLISTPLTDYCISHISSKSSDDRLHSFTLDYLLHYVKFSHSAKVLDLIFEVFFEDSIKFKILILQTLVKLFQNPEIRIAIMQNLGNKFLMTISSLFSDLSPSKGYIVTRSLKIIDIIITEGTDEEFEQFLSTDLIEAICQPEGCRPFTYKASTMIKNSFKLATNCVIHLLKRRSSLIYRLHDTNLISFLLNAINDIQREFFSVSYKATVMNIILALLEIFPNLIQEYEKQYMEFSTQQSLHIPEIDTVSQMIEMIPSYTQDEAINILSFLHSLFERNPEMKEKYALKLSEVFDSQDYSNVNSEEMETLISYFDNIVNFHKS